MDHTRYRPAFAPEPSRRTGAFNAKDVAAGNRHFCAVEDVTGKVFCWGHGEYGEMGDGTTGGNHVPEEVVGITGALEVDLGNDVSCARLSNKTIKCWGIISNGSLGYGEGPVSAPVYDITSTKSLSLGANHSCAVLENGSAKCWGNGGSGRIGDGYANSRTYPVSVYGLTNASQIITGYDFTCALKTDGKIACWGNNLEVIIFIFFFKKIVLNIQNLRSFIN